MKRFLVGLFLILSTPIFAMDEIEECELAEFSLNQNPNESDHILDYTSLSIALIMHQARMPTSVKKAKKNTEPEHSFFEIIGAYNAALMHLMKRFKD